jgi:hypothetical protein
MAQWLKTVARCETNPPRALAWVLRNDRLVMASAVALTAAIWYLSEPIIVTYDTFAYLNAAKFFVGMEGGALRIFG